MHIRLTMKVVLLKRKFFSCHVYNRRALLVLIYVLSRRVWTLVVLVPSMYFMLLMLRADVGGRGVSAWACRLDVEFRELWGNVAHDYEATNDQEVSLKVGQKIRIISNEENGWRQAKLLAEDGTPQYGWFPATYVDMEPEPEVDSQPRVFSPRFHRSCSDGIHRSYHRKLQCFWLPAFVLLLHYYTRCNAEVVCIIILMVWYHMPNTPRSCHFDCLSGHQRWFAQVIRYIPTGDGTAKQVMARDGPFPAIKIWNHGKVTRQVGLFGWDTMLKGVLYNENQLQVVPFSKGAHHPCGMDLLISDGFSGSIYSCHIFIVIRVRWFP